MVVHVHKIGSNEFKFVLTPQAAQELELSDGSAVDIRSVDATACAANCAAKEYVSTDEALGIYHRTKDRFRHAYEELAK